MDKFKNKYLKYKLKYLGSINQIGGEIKFQDLNNNILSFDGVLYPKSYYYIGETKYIDLLDIKKFYFSYIGEIKNFKNRMNNPEKKTIEVFAELIIIKNSANGIILTEPYYKLESLDQVYDTVILPFNEDDIIYLNLFINYLSYADKNSISSEDDDEVEDKLDTLSNNVSKDILKFNVILNLILLTINSKNYSNIFHKKCIENIVYILTFKRAEQVKKDILSNTDVMLMLIKYNPEFFLIADKILTKNVDFLNKALNVNVEVFKFFLYDDNVNASEPNIKNLESLPISITDRKDVQEQIKKLIKKTTVG